MFFLLSLLSLSALYAESWRYALEGESGDYMSVVESVLSTIPYINSEEELLRVEERIERNNRVEYEKKKATLYEKEDYSSLSKLVKKEASLPLSLTLEKVSLNYSDYKDLLRENDPDTIEYLMRENNLDALFYIKSQGEGTIKEITLSLNGEVIRKAYYTNSLFSYEEEALLDYLSSRLLSSSFNYYKISLSPSHSSLVIDGVVKTTVSPFVILENGEHTFSLAASGYESKDEKITLTGEEREIELSLSPQSSHSLYISTLPWNVDVRVNGGEIEGKYIPSIHSPYTLSLTSPSFSSYSYQTTSNSERVRIEMEGEWGEEENILEKKKNEFYKSIFSTLISFGGYTAFRAVENINGTQSPLKVVLGGVSIVSLINLVSSAMDYYGSASQEI